MAVAYASSNITEQSGDALVTVTKPTGLAVGDMLLAICMRGSDGVAVSGWNVPSGWTLIANRTVTNRVTTLVAAKVADSGDVAAASFDFTPDGADGNKSAVTLMRLTGTFTAGTGLFTSDNDVDDSTGGENHVTFTGGVTPVGASALLIMVLALYENIDIAYSNYSVVNNNPTWTELYDRYYDPSGNGLAYGIAYGSYASATATGNYAADVDSNGANYTGVLISLSESVNITVSPTVVTTTISVQAPSITTGSSYSPSVITTTVTVQAPTVTTSLPKWVNTDKSSTTWSNSDKS